MSSKYNKILKGEMIPGLNMYLDAESQKDRGVITLKEHFGSSICVNAMRNADTKVHNVSEDKLRKGEMSASVYSVGCYAIRDAVVLVKDEFPQRYDQRIPANAKQIADYMEFRKQWGFLAMSGFREIQVIYAAYKYDPEHYGEISFESIAKMAETVNGSFCFSILTDTNDLYLVKGSNPLVIYECGGYYLYASTANILDKTLKRLHIHKKISVDIKSGEIVKISADGTISRGSFDNEDYGYSFYPYWSIRFGGELCRG